MYEALREATIGVEAGGSVAPSMGSGQPTSCGSFISGMSHRLVKLDKRHRTNKKEKEAKEEPPRRFPAPPRPVRG